MTLPQAGNSIYIYIYTHITLLQQNLQAVARIPVPATIILKFAVPGVFKFEILKFIDNSTCKCYIQDTENLFKLIPKLPWMLHYIK